MQRRRFIRLVIVGHVGEWRHGGAFDRGRGLGYLLEGKQGETNSNVDMMEGLTGVISRSESASVADVAASIRSSHLLPIAAAAAAPGGSAENAFLPSILNLAENSFDFVFSCLGLRLFWVIEDFRGLLPFSFLCIESFLCSGGKVVERPGGECAIIEGSNSLGLGEWNGGIDCLLR